MRVCRFLPLLIAFGLAAQAQQPTPRFTAVEPARGKAGDVLTISGENLDKDNVKKLYLTDGKNDLEVEITEQAASSIKFKIPSKATPHRFALMILTGGKEPKLIEEPFKITVE